MILSFYKYADTARSGINTVFDTDFPVLHLIFPLAISFYTFQQIAYLVDSYKGKIKEYNFLNYALFISFFPQLIAGPIVHHKSIIPQFKDPQKNRINLNNLCMGLFIFSIGLFKKVAIADTFAVWSDAGFANPQMINLIEAWVASMAFGFQLYFDFSGYADMAIGIALLFNIKLPDNFKSPYRAASIQEFWKRWNITLSHFLRDYVSIPLKSAGLSIYPILFLTFLVSGFWHGAGLTFIVWGAMHGVALIIQDLWKRHGVRLPILVAWLITFNFINIVRVFFRADTIENALAILKAMFLSPFIVPANMQYFYQLFAGNTQNMSGYLFGMKDDFILCWIIGGFVSCLFYLNSNEMLARFKPNFRTLFITALLLIYSILILGEVKREFYYFAF